MTHCDLMNFPSGAGVPSREEFMARREKKDRLKKLQENRSTFKFDDLDIVTDGLSTMIFSNCKSNGGIRSVEYNLPIGKIWFTIHPYGVPGSKCECQSEYSLPGDKASYCIGRK